MLRPLSLLACPRGGARLATRALALPWRRPRSSARRGAGRRRPRRARPPADEPTATRSRSRIDALTPSAIPTQGPIAISGIGHQPRPTRPWTDDQPLRRSSPTTPITDPRRAGRGGRAPTPSTIVGDRITDAGTFDTVDELAPGRVADVHDPGARARARASPATRRASTGSACTPSATSVGRPRRRRRRPGPHLHPARAAEQTRQPVDTAPRDPAARSRSGAPPTAASTAPTRWADAHRAGRPPARRWSTSAPPPAPRRSPGWSTPRCSTPCAARPRQPAALARPTPDGRRARRAATSPPTAARRPSPTRADERGPRRASSRRRTPRPSPAPPGWTSCRRPGAATTSSRSRTATSTSPRPPTHDPEPARAGPPAQRPHALEPWGLTGHARGRLAERLPRPRRRSTAIRREHDDPGHRPGRSPTTHRRVARLDGQHAGRHRRRRPRRAARRPATRVDAARAAAADPQRGGRSRLLEPGPAARWSSCCRPSWHPGRLAPRTSSAASTSTGSS